MFLWQETELVCLATDIHSRVLIKSLTHVIQITSSNVTNLADATHDIDTNSIVDQDVHAVLTSVPNHSFLSPQALQGEVFYDDLDDVCALYMYLYS